MVHEPNRDISVSTIRSEVFTLTTPGSLLSSWSGVEWKAVMLSDFGTLRLFPLRVHSGVIDTGHGSYIAS